MKMWLGCILDWISAASLNRMCNSNGKQPSDLVIEEFCVISVLYLCFISYSRRVISLYSLGVYVCVIPSKYICDGIVCEHNMWLYLKEDFRVELEHLFETKQIEIRPGKICLKSKILCIFDRIFFFMLTNKY